MEPVLPVYHQIRRTIKYWILDRRYGPSDRIPPEHDLAKQFNVNRMTIRQALSSLVDEGLLIRKRGEGTFVTPNEVLIQGMSLKHINMTNVLLLPLMKSKTLTVAKTEIEPTPLIRNKLELNDDQHLVVMIKRDRLVPEGFRAFTINYLPLEIGRLLPEEELLERPLLKIMEDYLKINFIEAFETLEASFADEETAGHLGISPGVPTLVTERIMYADRGKPVELVNTIYDANLYKCCLHLKKVKRGRYRDPSSIEQELVRMVRERIGPTASFKIAIVVRRLPKTRSGKILRGTIKKIADGTEYRVPATIDDPGILDEIKESLAARGYPGKKKE